jgi:hypothetical protein
MRQERGETPGQTRPKYIGLSAYGYLVAVKVGLRQFDDEASDALWILNRRDEMRKLNAKLTPLIVGIGLEGNDTLDGIAGNDWMIEMSVAASANDTYWRIAA